MSVFNISRGQLLELELLLRRPGCASAGFQQGRYVDPFELVKTTKTSSTSAPPSSSTAYQQDQNQQNSGGGDGGSESESSSSTPPQTASTTTNNNSTTTYVITQHAYELFPWSLADAALYITWWALRPLTCPFCGAVDGGCLLCPDEGYLCAQCSASMGLDTSHATTVIANDTEREGEIDVASDDEDGGIDGGDGGGMGGDGGVGSAKTGGVVDTMATQTQSAPYPVIPITLHALSDVFLRLAPLTQCFYLGSITTVPTILYPEICRLAMTISYYGALPDTDPAHVSAIRTASVYLACCLVVAPGSIRFPHLQHIASWSSMTANTMNKTMLEVLSSNSSGSNDVAAEIGSSTTASSSGPPRHHLLSMAPLNRLDGASVGDSIVWMDVVHLASIVGLSVEDFATDPTEHIRQVLLGTIDVFNRIVDTTNSNAVGSWNQTAARQVNPGAHLRFPSAVWHPEKNRHAKSTVERFTELLALSEKKDNTTSSSSGLTAFAHHHHQNHSDTSSSSAVLPPPIDREYCPDVIAAVALIEIARATVEDIDNINNPEDNHDADPTTAAAEKPRDRYEKKEKNKQRDKLLQWVQLLMRVAKEEGSAEQQPLSTQSGLDGASSASMLATGSGSGSNLRTTSKEHKDLMSIASFTGELLLPCQPAAVLLNILAATLRMRPMELCSIVSKYSLDNTTGSSNNSNKNSNSSHAESSSSSVYYRGKTLFITKLHAGQSVGTYAMPLCRRASPAESPWAALYRCLYNDGTDGVEHFLIRRVLSDIAASPGGPSTLPDAVKTLRAILVRHGAAWQYQTNYVMEVNDPSEAPFNGFYFCSSLSRAGAVYCHVAKPLTLRFKGHTGNVFLNDSSRPASEKRHTTGLLSTMSAPRLLTVEAPTAVLVMDGIREGSLHRWADSYRRLTNASALRRRMRSVTAPLRSALLRRQIGVTSDGSNGSVGGGDLRVTPLPVEVAQLTTLWEWNVGVAATAGGLTGSGACRVPFASQSASAIRHAVRDLLPDPVSILTSAPRLFDTASSIGATATAPSVVTTTKTGKKDSFIHDGDHTSVVFPTDQLFHVLSALPPDVVAGGIGEEASAVLACPALTASIVNTYQNVRTALVSASSGSGASAGGTDGRGKSSKGTSSRGKGKGKRHRDGDQHEDDDNGDGDDGDEKQQSSVALLQAVSAAQSHSALRSSATKVKHLPFSKKSVKIGIDNADRARQALSSTLDLLSK